MIYSITFTPTEDDLVYEADLTTNFESVPFGETLIVDASGSGIEGLAPQWSSQRVSYEWHCPEEFADMCAAMQLPAGKLFFPYADERYFDKVRFVRPYEFGVTVNFHNADGDIVDTQEKTVEVRWDVPEVEIECQQRET